MGQSVRLFLIRHGETVDNVAQLYAGSRDSALTNHGYQQATRLGLHFKELGLSFTHLYSSHLQRAAKTAGLVREAQLASTANADPFRTVPEVTQLPILMEQDFGDLEGKRWSKMQAGLQNKPGHLAVETKEAMGQRADIFLDEHLLPLLISTSGGPETVIAIVSHGIFLSTLWKRLLQRLPAKSISLCSNLQATARSSLEHLGGWSNTGYLELLITRVEAQRTSLSNVAPSRSSKPDASQPSNSKLDDIVGVVEVAQIPAGGAAHGAITVAGDRKLALSMSSDPTIPDTPRTSTAFDCMTTILTINGKDHLKGLKRTGGGVGSSRHDASQRRIESFFKRRKVG
ncbi:hypothetical protein N0V94_003087 [Neodidymelliopsis sp. IMI 364377]|nr:hypothetical protein N0V94_003087 [Neodidymelliopsis sp. IMI 364377]